MMTVFTFADFKGFLIKIQTKRPFLKTLPSPWLRGRISCVLLSGLVVFHRVVSYRIIVVTCLGVLVMYAGCRARNEDRIKTLCLQSCLF